MNNQTLLEEEFKVSAINKEGQYFKRGLLLYFLIKFKK